MLCQPLLLLPITGLLIRFGVSAHPLDWLGTARIAALAISAYMMGAPFLLAVLLPKSSEQLRARGVDLDALLALTGVAGSILPLGCGLALVVCGDRLVFLYVGWFVSLAGMGYWTWRERELIFPSRPPVVPTRDPQ